LLARLNTLNPQDSIVANIKLGERMKQEGKEEVYKNTLWSSMQLDRRALTTMYVAWLTAEHICFMIEGSSSATLRSTMFHKFLLCFVGASFTIVLLSAYIGSSVTKYAIHCIASLHRLSLLVLSLYAIAINQHTIRLWFGIRAVVMGYCVLMDMRINWIEMRGFMDYKQHENIVNRTES
jgi:hypothetical protein